MKRSPWVETLFRPLAGITEIEPARPGTGDGAFVVVIADRTRDEVGSMWPPRSPQPDRRAT